MRTFRIYGRDSGLTVVEFGDGTKARLTDVELAALCDTGTEVGIAEIKELQDTNNAPVKAKGKAPVENKALTMPEAQ